MLSLAIRTRLALFTFVANVVAQTNGACPSNGISYRAEYYEIKFTTYCNTRLTNTFTEPPIPALDFAACSVACVDRGLSCGGFAFDRDSRYGSKNCYLNKFYNLPSPSSSSLENSYFDSAVINNSSLPLTRRDCTNIATLSNSQYVRYNFRCGEAIFDGSSSSDQLNKTFAASISDCIDHCTQYNTQSTFEICKAVTWDPSLLYGYNNCYLKGWYNNPVANSGWDSATLVGTTGYVGTGNITTSSSTSSVYIPTASAEPSANTSSNNNPSSSGEGLSTVHIAGIVVGVLLAVIIALTIILGLYFRNRTRRKQKGQAGNESVPPMSGPQPLPSTSQAAVMPNVMFYGPNNGKVVPREDKGKGKMRAIESEEPVIAGPSEIRYM